MERPRREYSRVRVSWPVVIYTPDGLIEGVTKNISLDGALIQCDRLPNLDDELNLSIGVPNSKFPVTALVKKVRLANCDGNTASRRHSLAVRFTEIAEDDRRVLYSAIEAQCRQSGDYSELPELYGGGARPES